jgi:KAP family P-loop domain
MWSDNETSIDLLGFQHLTKAARNIVENERLLPATIGIYGDWGSGKSSLIQMVKAELEKDEDIVVLSFNGWLFEGYEDAKTALMGTILEELLSHRNFLRKASEEAKKLGKRLLKRVNLLKVVTATGKLLLAAKTAGVAPLVLGLSGSSDLVEAGKQLTEKAKSLDLPSPEGLLKDQPRDESEETHSIRKTVREFRKDFSELLKQGNIKTLVVVIDDLDRCLPDTIIETLEAIKLFLFAEHTAFIIGTDEELVRYAVRKRFPEFPGDRREVGTAYLEKLIQFPIRVPPLGRSEVETYISLLFATLSGLSDTDLQKARESVVNTPPDDLLNPQFNLAVAQKMFSPLNAELADRLALAQRITPILSTGTNGNPRQCKRFLNTLLMRLSMASSRGVALSQRVLAKLMLLEYFKPEFFKQLAAAQLMQGGKPNEIARLEDAATGEPDASAPPTPPRSPASAHARPASTQEPPASDSVLAAEFQLWLSDPWTQDWLTTEPSFKDVDLRPYYFFSRDALGIIAGAVQRLSAPAQRILQKLLNESEAIRLNGLKEGERLNAADSAAIFEALANRTREEEDHSHDNSALLLLIEWARVRTHLRFELLLVLGSLAENAIPINVPARLVLLAQDAETKTAIRELLQRWSRSTSSAALAKTAQTAISRLANP